MARAQSTVVGKALEASLVVLYVALLTAVLYGGAVPSYQSAAGDAVAERTVATAALRVQQAVPPAVTRVDARVRVDLPATIAGAAYELRVEDRVLVLVHPDPAVGSRARLALPSSVDRVEGRWRSGAPALVRVTGGDGRLVVRLES